jgi:hypothetical protein
MTLCFYNFAPHHSTGQKAGKRFAKKAHDLEAPFKITILSYLSAPPAHKVKLLVELHLLQQQQKLMLDCLNKTLENPTSIISNEEIYLQNIGEENRVIKQTEDELRKLFVAEDVDLATVQKGNNLLINVYEVYLF